MQRNPSTPKYLGLKFKSLGAGIVEMKFFSTVNVTEVKIKGTATRGEKIDIDSSHFLRFAIASRFHLFPRFLFSNPFCLSLLYSRNCKPTTKVGNAVYF